MINPGETPQYKIDVHQHFWNYNPVEYDWMSESMDSLKRDFLPRDLKKDRSGTGYESSITVQARQTREETDWLLKLAEESTDILGVVGWLDLCSPDIPDTLSQYSNNPMLKGLRHVLQNEEDDDFMLRPDFLNGISHLESAGLLYELLISPKHLKNTIRLVEMFPGQRFVLDHIAKPQIKDGIINEWADLLSELASFENVSCKVSGLVTEADWKSWKPTNFYPYLDAVWNSFGKNRIMIGSDWPVCNLAATFAQTVCLAEGYFEKYGLDVLRKVTAGNSSLIYHL